MIARPALIRQNFPGRERRGRVWAIALRHARDKGFLHGLPPRETLWQQFKLSLPSTMQQLFFAAGLVTLVWIVGRIGTGDTRRSMWISFLAQWAFFLPLAYLVGPVLGFGLLGVWLLNVIYRAGQALVCAWQWHTRKWVGIDI